MADSTWMPVDLQVKQAEMARKQKLAETILGAVQAPQAQIVGGQYVGPGILGQALPLIKAMMGQKLENDNSTANTKFLLENQDRLGAAGNPKDLYKSGKYDTQSIAEYEKSGRASDLQLKPKEWDPLSGVTWTQETVTTPDGKTLQRGYTRNGQETYKALPSGTTIHNNMPQPESAWNKEGPKFLLKQLADERPQAEKATRLFDTYRVAKSRIDDGVITGTFANQETFLRGMFDKITGQDNRKVANTQELMAIMGQVVRDNISAFGSGTAISDADRQYAMLTSGADMTVKLRALKNIIAIGEAEAANKITSYKSMVNSVRNSSGADQSMVDAMTYPAEIPSDIGAKAGPDGRFTPNLEVLDDPINGAGSGTGAPIPPPIVTDFKARLNKLKGQ